MRKSLTLGTILHSFFIDHLKISKGLQPTSISSYRDRIRLFLLFIAKDTGRSITKLEFDSFTSSRVLRFLQSLEEKRGNHIRTRNQRLAILRTFFEYLGERMPETLIEAEKVARIPIKRSQPVVTHYLDREEVEKLFSGFPTNTWAAQRDLALLLFLYNTGARVQEVASLQISQLDLGSQPRVSLLGKGGKWRTCPLWKRTAEHLKNILEKRTEDPTPEDPLFISQRKLPLTRFGIYKIVRRAAAHLDQRGPKGYSRRISPHLFRHTTAVHLLESGVELNVIRGWLGHVRLETTNHYAEITRKTKEAALRRCTAPMRGKLPSKASWNNDSTLLNWLNSL